MSGLEIVVIVFGLFLGYWLVSKITGGKRPERASPPPHENTSQNESRTSQENRSQSEQKPGAGYSPWHEVLQVPSGASLEEIHCAYKSLMSQYHPDKVASLGEELKFVAERKTKQITAAYREAMLLKGEAH